MSDRIAPILQAIADVDARRRTVQRLARELEGVAYPSTPLEAAIASVTPSCGPPANHDRHCAMLALAAIIDVDPDMAYGLLVRIAVKGLRRLDLTVSELAADWKGTTEAVPRAYTPQGRD